MKKKQQERNDDVPIGIRLPPEMAKALRELAKRNERGVSGEIRAALRPWLRRKPLGVLEQESAEVR